MTVLERAARAGGNLRTERVDGYLCEWGPNGFLDNVPETLALVRALGICAIACCPADAARQAAVHLPARPSPRAAGRPGRLRPEPACCRSRAALRVMGEPFAAASPRRRRDDSRVCRRAASGVEAADVLIDSMVSGVFGGNARELSLRACFPKMWEMETRARQPREGDAGEAPRAARVRPARRWVRPAGT